MNWNIIENYLINISFGLLIITLITYWLNITFSKIKSRDKISPTLIIITNILLALGLSIRWINNQYFPLSNLYESLIFLTWCLTLIQIILEHKSNNKLIGAINTPISLFTLAFASICLPEDMKIAIPLVPALKSNWLIMHVTIMMISYATLMIGCILSVLFLIISYGQKINIQGNSYLNGKKILLKYKSSNIKNILTPKKNSTNNIDNNCRINLLQGIDNLSYRTIGLGFPLLTIGIISGAVWANEAWGTYWSWDPKETWALITWIIFAVYLHSRLNQAWKGKKPAIIASVGFILIWVCYLGVNFLGKGLHSYGWILS